MTHPLLSLYLTASRLSGPIWRRRMKARLAEGKERADRLPEKFGKYRREWRPTGPVMWFHALSVGECLALLPLIERAVKERPEATMVLTTSTATSIEALERIGLPPRTHHIMLPVDTARATRRFLNFWRPTVAVFAELDFWPRLMWATQYRGIPMVLVNSRLSPKSFESRKRLRGMMREILGYFDALLVQDRPSFERFVELGAEPRLVTVVGPLKAAARPLPVSDRELADLDDAIGPRPVWLAAATHDSEDAAVLKAHYILTEADPDALLILAPRHVGAADQAEEMADEAFETVARRSRGELPDARTQVYIADTIGEMGLWYRLASVSFVGHSLAPGLTGKNPFEAAALSSAVLHGPHIDDFLESYGLLSAEGGSRQVEDAELLAGMVLELFDESERLPMIEGAFRVVRSRRMILENTWTVVNRAYGARLAEIEAG